MEKITAGHRLDGGPCCHDRARSPRDANHNPIKQAVVLKIARRPHRSEDRAKPTCKTAQAMTPNVYLYESVKLSAQPVQH